MFPTIVGAWVLDGGEAGRSRFCYPKGQSRAAAPVEGLRGRGLIRPWMYPRQCWDWGGRETRWGLELGVGRSESISKSRRPSPERCQKAQH